MTDVRDLVAETIARAMPGYNEDTSEPPRPGWTEDLRRHMEEHWKKINAECLRQGYEHADALLADSRLRILLTPREGLADDLRALNDKFQQDTLGAREPLLDEAAAALDGM